MGEPGPVRGTLKFDATTGNLLPDEASDKYRLAMHILYNMDTTTNTQKDGDNKEWVNTVDNYKNYLADWNDDSNIDAQDLSELCHKGAFGIGGTDVDIPKPWAPTAVIRGGDKELIMTDSAATNRLVTLTFAYNLDNNSTEDYFQFNIHRNDNGAKVDDAVVAVRHLGTDAAKTKTFEITLNNDSNWASSDNKYYVKHTQFGANFSIRFDNPADPIYNFDTQAHTFEIDASNFKPKATISVFDDDQTNASRNQINTGGSVNPATFIYIEIVFNRKVNDFIKDHIEIKDEDGNDITKGDFDNDGDSRTFFLKVLKGSLTNGKEHTIKILKTTGATTTVSQKMTTIEAEDSDDFKITFDSTAPTIDSAVIDTTGKIVTLTMSEDVFLSDPETVNDHRVDFKIAGQDPGTLARGTGNNTLVFTLPTAITNDVTSIEVVYAASAGTIKDGAGNSLAYAPSAMFTTGGSTLTNGSTEVVTYEVSYGDTTTDDPDDLDMHIIYDGNTGLLSVKKWDSLGTKQAKMVFQNTTDQTELFGLFSNYGGALATKTYDAFGRGTAAFTKS